MNRADRGAAASAHRTPDTPRSRSRRRSRGRREHGRSTTPRAHSRSSRSRPPGAASTRNASTPPRQDVVPRAPGRAPGAPGPRGGRALRWLRRLLELARADLPLPDAALAGALPDVKFIFTGPSEALILYMKMAFFAGIFLAAPYFLYQVGPSSLPASTPTRSATSCRSSCMGTFFFVGGRRLRPLLPVPVTFRFLGQFGGKDMQFLPKIDEYFSFYSWFLLGLGASSRPRSSSSSSPGSAS